MRRKGIAGGVIALLTLLGGVAAYSFRVAPRWLEIVRLRVAVPALPDAWIGLRVAHLSDFHAGGAVSLDLLRRAKSEALAFSPDVVALTGDYYDEGRRSDAGDLFTLWPDGLPVVAVLGNHDHRASDRDLQQLVNELTVAGVDLLSNRAVERSLRGQPAWIVGVDDPYSWKMSEEVAFGDMPDTAEALLYLAHSPVAAKTLPVGRVRLMLAGHTHGGQVRLTADGSVPFVSLARRLYGNAPRPDPDVHRGVHWRRAPCW